MYLLHFHNVINIQRSNSIPRLARLWTHDFVFSAFHRRVCWQPIALLTDACWIMTPRGIISRPSDSAHVVDTRLHVAFCDSLFTYCAFLEDCCHGYLCLLDMFSINPSYISSTLSDRCNPLKRIAGENTRIRIFLSTLQAVPVIAAAGL